MTLFFGVFARYISLPWTNSVVLHVGLAPRLSGMGVEQEGGALATAVVAQIQFGEIADGARQLENASYTVVRDAATR